MIFKYEKMPTIGKKQRKQKCQNCGGSGVVDWEQQDGLNVIVDCKKCNGTGYVKQ